MSAPDEAPEKDPDKTQDEAPTALPPILPVFPLSGAVLMPRGTLPLNIFEPRYLTMVRDAAAGDGMIGMIQPKSVPPAGDGGSAPLHTIGCAGRIAEMEEQSDGRIILILKGVCRYAVGTELDVTTPYRQIQPNWAPFRHDLATPPLDEGIDRAALTRPLRRYLTLRGLDSDFDAIDKAPDEVLVNTLAAIVPFEPLEKQALIEAADTASRATTLISLMEMILAAETAGTEPTDFSPN
ncbi:LON peptidase substrate-binding domain-containing protein [Yunchengibacter salinarum]|uniref:LON peptidase substrate-binding domain-containing protein n=1 Tax=Yunchengibacter salinarum TaxID=3133399 RepID=UPI0035B68B27